MIFVVGQEMCHPDIQPQEDMLLQLQGLALISSNF
jgi:hypothetical protein